LAHTENLNNIDANKVIVSYVSETAKTYVLKFHQPFLESMQSILLYNTFDSDDIHDHQLNNKKEMSICYFASLDRGYELLPHIMEKLDDYKLYASTYNTEHSSWSNSKIKLSERIVSLENTSKYNVFQYISRSRYFIYPLINLENSRIHYDTFGYCVLEALLHGTVVIAPKMRIFEELYGDAICYLDTLDIIPPEWLLYSNQPNPNFGFPLVDRYVEKVRFLDENPDVRNMYIQRGLKLKNKFCNKRLAKELVEALQSDYQRTLNAHLQNLSRNLRIPTDHVNYLQYLKSSGFEPKVIYDIGSCVLSWTREAKQLWPEAKIILFDAFRPAEFLYEGHDYHIGALSDEDGKTVSWYQNDFNPTGNSYYREVGNREYFPEDSFVEYKTDRLDTIVAARGFPLPDFVKIDVQGAEVDIVRGGSNTLKNAQRLIIELQSVEYNKGAELNTVSLPIIEETLGVKCVAPLFCNNGPDGDYAFVRNDA
jgi:FkbM family methyltransferase